MSNGPAHVVVRAAAPIPMGDEIEIHLVRKTWNGREIELSVIRHLSTSAMYGASDVFDDHPTHPVLGDADLYRAPRVSPLCTIVRTFHARVRECVVSNVSIDQGNGDSYIAAVTSFLVEPIAAPQAYR